MMVLVFALVGLVGFVLLLVGVVCCLNPDTIHSRRWVIVFFIGLVLTVIGWTGGLAIQDIEEDAIRQEYEYVYNYCPRCGERLKGE